jgi:hypothetical protein
VERCLSAIESDNEDPLTGNSDSQVPALEMAPPPSEISTPSNDLLDPAEIPPNLVKDADTSHLVAGVLPCGEITFIEYSAPLDRQGRIAAEKVLLIYTERMLEQDLYLSEQLHLQKNGAPSFATQEEATASRESLPNPTAYLPIESEGRFLLIDVGGFWDDPRTQELGRSLKIARRHLKELGYSQKSLPYYPHDSFMLGLER